MTKRRFISLLLLSSAIASTVACQAGGFRHADPGDAPPGLEWAPDAGAPFFGPTRTVMPYTGSEAAVLEAQTNLPTGIELQAEVVIRSCGPINGVCHNEKEYPDLHTPANFASVVGAPCNVCSREDERYAELLRMNPDGSELESVPYSLSTSTFEVRRLQVKGINRFGVYLPLDRESLNYHYERNAEDPRIAHSLVIEADAYGDASARPVLLLHGGGQTRHSWGSTAATLAAGLLAPRVADAFCGFYVAGGDAKLYNNATVVVMLRDGTRTVLSMQNN